jgi:uncharacterized membrane protein (DUF4010 family)
MEPSVFIGFLLAIALGGLIGTERELPWSGTKPGGATGFWGIRTYASIAFLGAIAVWLDQALHTNFWTFFWALISGIFILMSYGYSSFRRDKMGATSEYAGLITYFIWVIAMLGEYTLAVILGILLLLLLSSKEYFTRLKSQFSRQELGDSLKFAVIALVILPLLPDTKYSILDMANYLASGSLSWIHPVLIAKFFNPYGIWFFVVVMAGVEYAGFLLGKAMWDKWGILASGAVWWLISSTATTVAMTRKSKQHPEHRNSYATATLLASCIMFIRVMVVASYIYPTILDSILLPGIMMFVWLASVTVWNLMKAWKEKVPVVTSEKEGNYESPFQLLPALQFAGLIVIIKFIAILGKVYKDIVPQSVSNYFLGLVSGFADVDAVNFAMSEWARDGSIPLFIAATTILIAVMSNNTVKASIAYRFWEREYGRKVVTGFTLSIVLGLVTIVGMYLVN